MNKLHPFEDQNYQNAWKDGYAAGVQATFNPSLRWVSVKDSVPENSDKVLVHLVILYSEIKIGFYDDGRFYHSNGLGDEHITKWVIHWMPLPEPPT